MSVVTTSMSSIPSRPGSSPGELAEISQTFVRPDSSSNQVATDPTTILPREGKRILLVDDNRFTVTRVTRELGHYYPAGVDFAESAAEAARLIRESVPPYDCLILDVVMPGKWGTDLLAELPSICAGGKIPAVVLHTMSVANNRLADISDQFASHAADKLESLLGELGTSLDASQIPRSCILQHHKSGSIDQLARKIDLSIYLNQNNFGDLVDFLAGFVPRAFPQEVDDIVVHRFSELLINFARGCSQLLEACDVSFSGRYRPQNEASSIHDSVLEFLSATYSSIKCNTPRQTLERMHILINKFAGLSSGIVGISPQREGEADFDEVRQFVSTSKKELSALFDFQKGLTIGEVKIADLLENIERSCKGIRFSYSNIEHLREKNATLSDPGRSLTDLIIKVCKAFDARLTPDVPWSLLEAHVLETYRSPREPESILEKLNGMGITKYLRIKCEDINSTVSLDQSYGEVIPQLAMLQKNNEGCFYVNPLSDTNRSRNYFYLYIRLDGHRTVNTKVVEQVGIHEPVSMSPRKFDEHHAATEFIIGRDTFVGLHRFRELDGEADSVQTETLSDAWHLVRRGIYYQEGNSNYISVGEKLAHSSGAWTIALYLREQAPKREAHGRENLGSNLIESSDDIYKHCVRMDGAGEERIIVDTDSPMVEENIRQSLLRLGFKNFVLVRDPSHFMLRF